MVYFQTAKPISETEAFYYFIFSPLQVFALHMYNDFIISNIQFHPGLGISRQKLVFGVT